MVLKSSKGYCVLIGPKPSHADHGLAPSDAPGSNGSPLAPPPSRSPPSSPIQIGSRGTPPPTTSPPTPAPPGSTPRRRPSPDRSPDALRRLQHRRLPPRPELNRGARPRGAPSLGAAPHRRHRLASSPLPRATPATPSLTEHAVTIPTSRREPRLLLPSSVSRAHRGRVAPWPRTPAPSGLTRPHWLHVGSRTATSHRCRPARPRRPRPVPLPASPVTAPVVASASLRPPAAARASPRPPPRSAPRRQPPRRQPQRPHTSAHSG